MPKIPHRDGVLIHTTGSWQVLLRPVGQLFGLLDLLKCEADLVGSLADVLPDPDAPRKLTKALHIVRASGAKSAFEAMSWGGGCYVIEIAAAFFTAGLLTTEQCARR